MENKRYDVSRPAHGRGTHKRDNKKQSQMESALISKYKEICQNPQKYARESQWIAPKSRSVRGVKYIGFLGSTGYADAAKGYIRSLVESGTYVVIEPVKYCSEKGTEILSNDDSVLAVCLHNTHLLYDTVIIHSIPTNWKKYSDRERAMNPSVRIFGLTVWETDRIYPKWLDLISEASLDGLIVPTEWNRQTFIDSARNHRIHNFPPVYVCHHAITDRQHREGRLPLKREHIYGPHVKLAFLCIGTWTPRKGIGETIEAYLEAFQGHSDVVLYVKTTTGKYSEEDTAELRQRLDKLMYGYKHPPKIILDTKLRSDDHIDDLVKNCDVYLSLCNSEGVGLGACQAALKGKIVIMTGYGGQKEYIMQGNWIDYKLGVVRVPDNFAEWIRPPQQWAYPDLNHAVRCLRDVYQRKDIYEKQSEENRSYTLDKFSYIARGQQFNSIFSENLSTNPPHQVFSKPVSVEQINRMAIEAQKKYRSRSSEDKKKDKKKDKKEKKREKSRDKKHKHGRHYEKDDKRHREKDEDKERERYARRLHRHDICERCQGHIIH